jgi:hypothetical protein
LPSGGDKQSMGTHRLADAHHPENPAVRPQGRGHVHHGRVGVIRPFQGGAGAVLALERPTDVTPATEVHPLVPAEGIEEDPPVAVGDVHPQIHAGLGEAEDLGRETSPVRGIENASKLRRVRAATSYVVFDYGRENVGDVHQGLFRGLTIPGVQVALTR